tara:strand:- start:2083 stop:2628 length:546 start_codon:yes stop_codon:yes gene_type:complete
VFKKKIRNKILNLRKKNYKKKYKINFLTLLNILKKNKIKKGIVGGYFPINYEIDDLNILKELELKKFKISLPIVKNNNKIDFYLWSLKDSLRLNDYGIPEPFKNKMVYPDILLVPLVAFDHKRFRLGYGGGFYDRYIERLEKIKNFVSIGLAFEYQKVKKLKISKYDKKLDIILTNKSIYK